MKEAMQKAQTVMRDVLREFEPTRGHFVAGTREFLLAMRSVVDAQIALFDRATKKKDSGPQEQGGA
jgi:hypothetical protein